MTATDYSPFDGDMRRRVQVYLGTKSWNVTKWAGQETIKGFLQRKTHYSQSGMTAAILDTWATYTDRAISIKPASDEGLGLIVTLLD